MTTSFDDKAKTWDDDPAKRERAKKAADSMRQNIPVHKKIQALEYGCGTGLLSFELYHDLGHITLLDTSRGMIEVLERKIAEAGATNMTPRIADLSAGDGLDDQFDLVYTLLALHHVESVETALEAFHRVLKPGGFLCIGDLDREDGSFHGEGFAGHHGFARDALKRQLEGLDFVDVQFWDCFTIVKGEGDKAQEFSVFLMTCRRNPLG